MFAQFFVADGALSCQMYQRSADLGLGVPFNIASYALLTCIFAHLTGLKRGSFVHTIGDAHVYLNHVDALKEQLKREPRPFPTLTIDPKVDSIESCTFADLTIDGYDPYPKIKMDMAV
jgi:thymidylate synthase